MIVALQQLGYFFRLIRWFHGLLALFPFATLYFIIVHSEKSRAIPVDASDFALICICVQLLMAIGFIWNDWRDMRIDQINKPHTHLIGRKISLLAVKRLFATITLLIIFLTVHIALEIFAEWMWISPGVYALSIAYSLYLKRSP